MMDEQVKPQGKRSLDEIIEHMTADVQNNDGQYIPLGLTPPQTPVSAGHVWTEYASLSPSTSGPVHTYIPHPQIITSSADNPVYFTDFPSHFGVDLSPHLSKQNELQQQNFFYTPQQQLGLLSENREVIRTVMDVGGGNIVNVVYGARTPENHGNIIPQPFHMVAHEPPRETLPHPLGGFVPYHQPGVVDSASASLKDYGLFTGSDLQQQQQQQQQQQTPQQQLNISQQSQPTQHQLLQHQQHEKQQQQSLSHSRQGHRHSQFQATPSNNQGQLIENLVGNWVPNQSGTYSPFGCTDTEVKPVPTTSQQTTQTVSEHLDSEGEGKGVNRNTRKTRIVAEVRPMRPSYSDVLTKSPPPQQSSASSNSKHNGNNHVSSSNKSENTGNNGKSKNMSVSKVTNKKNKNGLLKRQHSSGSDEHNGSWGPAPVKIIQSPAASRKVIGVESKQNISPSAVSGPRKWASLDDLEDSQPEGEEDDSVPVIKGEIQPVKKAVGVASPRMKTAPSHDDKWDSVGATLNNHKQSAFSLGAKGAGGTSAAKRPIHINNNLGTSQWGPGTPGQPGGTPGGCASTMSTNTPGEKNVMKGGGKACKTCGDDKKANGPAVGVKTASASLSSGRASSRSSSVGGGQGGATPAEKLSQGKRGLRHKKKDCQSPIFLACQPLRQQLSRWGRLGIAAVLWFLHLLSDVLGMSTRLLAHLCVFSWNWLRLWWLQFIQRVWGSFSRVGARHYGKKRWWHFWRWGASSSTSTGNDHRGSSPDSGSSPRFKDGFPPGLEANISLPSTGEEAMKRLLACKGKDPYSILGVTPHSTDDDIKKYYKRQAFLVHPDKNSQPGAEEAFKILVHAFELIGEPERRKAYDHRVAETQQVEQAWSELSDLLSQLHQKMEYAANTIRCTNCGKRHRRISVDRPCYAARLCSQCKIHHAAREGDIWAESTMFGFLWHYYACMDGAIYDITEWAACQADNLRHLRANTHSVQYRIVLGRQNQSSSNHQAPPPHHHHRRAGATAGHRRSQASGRDPDLEDFLNNLYNQSGSAGSSGDAPGNRADQARHRRKGKRKK